MGFAGIDRMRREDKARGGARQVSFMAAVKAETSKMKKHASDERRAKQEKVVMLVLGLGVSAVVVYKVVKRL